MKLFTFIIAFFFGLQTFSPNHTVSASTERDEVSCIKHKTYNVPHSKQTQASKRANQRKYRPWWSKGEFTYEAYKITRDSPYMFYVWAFGYNPLFGGCRMIIDAISLEKDRDYLRTNLFYNPAELFISQSSGSQSVKIGIPYDKHLGGAKYTFQISRCRARRMTISITEDLRLYPGAKCKLPVKPEELTSPITFDMSGFTKEVRKGKPTIIRVTRGANPTIGEEVSISREVGFSYSRSRGGSLGLNLKVFQGQLQEAVDKAKEAKFEQTITSIHTVTLNYDVCDTWRIDKYMIVELGHALAPGLGVTDKLPFTVVLGQKITAKPLCDKKNNIASNKRVSEEQKIINTYTQNQKSELKEPVVKKEKRNSDT